MIFLFEACFLPAAMALVKTHNHLGLSFTVIYQFRIKLFGLAANGKLEYCITMHDKYFVFYIFLFFLNLRLILERDSY